MAVCIFRKIKTVVFLNRIHDDCNILIHEWCEWIFHCVNKLPVACDGSSGKWYKFTECLCNTSNKNICETINRKESIYQNYHHWPLSHVNSNLISPLQIITRKSCETAHVQHSLIFAHEPKRKSPSYSQGKIIIKYIIIFTVPPILAGLCIYSKR